MTGPVAARRRGAAAAAPSTVAAPRRGAAAAAAGIVAARRSTAAGLVATVVLAVPAAAFAADGVSLTLSTSAARAFAARGVTVSAIAPAKRSGRRIALPVTSAGAAGVQTGGALWLRAGARTLTLNAPRLTMGRVRRLSAVLAGRRTTVWAFSGGSLTIDSNLVLRGARLALTPSAAAAIARRLHVRALPRRSFARLDATVTYPAKLPSAPAATAPPAIAGGCRGVTTGGAATDPGSGVPSVKARPAGALTVVAATLSWHVRDSFIRYLASGEGTATSRGATGDPAVATAETNQPLVYGFHFPIAPGGWCDPATGAARVAFTGTVAFRYADHGIDLRANDPEVELDGTSSRVIFRMTGSGATDGGDQRAVVETLDLSKAAAVTSSADGKTVGYEQIPAAIPPGAATSVFAGYYLPGDPFGWVSISFTTA